MFNHDGTHFIAGATAEFAIFDISRYNEGPMERKKIGYRKNSGHYNPKGLDWTREITGPNDIISTMDLSAEDMFAMGTWGRKVAIYAGAGRGELVTTFSPDQVESGSNRFGEGISQVKWSPCGRYLYVAERHSAGIHIYDIRGAGKRVGYLMGREAKTAVKLSFDVVPTAEGSEIWAGGTDGKIRMWKNPEQRGGVVSWDEEWTVHGGNDLVCVLLWYMEVAVSLLRWLAKSDITSELLVATRKALPQVEILCRANPRTKRVIPSVTQSLKRPQRKL